MSCQEYLEKFLKDISRHQFSLSNCKHKIGYYLTSLEMMYCNLQVNINTSNYFKRLLQLHLIHELFVILQKYYVIKCYFYFAVSNNGQWNKFFMKNILSLFYFFFFFLFLFLLLLLFFLFFFSLTGLIIEGWTKSDIIKLITHKLKLTMTNGNFVMYWILKHDWTTTVYLSRKIFHLTPF